LEKRPANLVTRAAFVADLKKPARWRFLHPQYNLTPVCSVGIAGGQSVNVVFWWRQLVRQGVPSRSFTTIKLAAHRDLGVGFNLGPDTHRSLKAAPMGLDLMAVKPELGNKPSFAVSNQSLTQSSTKRLGSW